MREVRTINQARTACKLTTKQVATNTDVLMVLSGVGDVVMVKVAVAIRKKVGTLRYVFHHSTKSLSDDKRNVTCTPTNQKLCQET